MKSITEYSVFISAGESSADSLGAAAIRAVRNCLPENAYIDWRGSAGRAMREAGVEAVCGQSTPSAAGLLELLPRARELYEFRRKLFSSALDRHYDLALLIDMPDFHLPLGRRLMAAGIPVLLYVPPQTWAWRSSRAADLPGCCNRAAVLFEFEKRHLARFGVQAEYVGHPILDGWHTTEKPAPEKSRALRIALLPGSRIHEIACNLPPMLEAAELLGNRGFEFEVVHMSENREQIYRLLDASASVKPIERSYMQPDAYDLALCGAGTVSLELAAAGTPFVLCHRISHVSYTLARHFIKTGLFAMPNILAGYAAAPELIQAECRAGRIAEEVMHMLCDGGAERQRKAWMRLGSDLKRKPCDSTIAELILDMLDIKPRSKTSFESA